MRVAFFGTPDFALPSLLALYEAEDMEIALVVSQPDRRRSRGKWSPTPIKEEAISLSLPVETPDSVNEPSFLSLLEKAEPDILVVIAFGQLLDDAILHRYDGRILNIHASLLPQYRGAAPIQRAMLAGEHEIGVTAMLVEKQLDAGDMLRQASIPLTEDDLKTVTDKLGDLGAEVLLDTLRHFEQYYEKRVPQEDEKATYAQKIEREDGLLHMQKPAKMLVRQVATVSDWPGARIRLNEEEYKVHAAHAQEDFSKGEVGEVLRADKKGIAIQTGDGVFVIDVLQPPNKKAMSVAAFLNGHSIEPGTKVTPWETQ